LSAESVILTGTSSSAAHTRQHQNNSCAFQYYDLLCSNIRQRIGCVSDMFSDISFIRVFTELGSDKLEQELNYRKQIACQLHTQYIEGISDL